MIKFILALLVLGLSLGAHAGEWRRLDMLNQFGAAAVPAADSAAYRTATEFMDGARPGGTLKIAWFESMVSIHPSPIRNGDFRPRAPLAPDFIFETLMTLDPRQDDYTVYPLVARDLDVAPDFCTIRVGLDPAARFGDGTPLRTRDVAFSLEKYNAEFFSGAMAELVARIMGKPQLTAVDDRTFEVHFIGIEPSGCRKAAYYFLAGVPLIKPNPSAKSAAFAEVEMPFIGSGPYRVATAQRALLRLERDSDYWARDHARRQKMFNPATVEVRVYMDPVLERFALLRGDINVMRETHFTYDDWMRRQMLTRPIKRIDQHSDALATEVGAVWMNQSHAHTGNVDFRRALLLVWDVARANHDFYANRRHALKAPGLQSPLYPHGPPSAAVLELLGRAKDDPNYQSALGPMEQLDYERLSKPKGVRNRLHLALGWLRHAGYEFRRQRGHTVLTLNGRPVEITGVVRMGSPELKLFLRFKNELRLIGIDLKLREYGDRSALVAALMANDYDLFPSGLDLARDFTIVNSSYLLMELHSSSAKGLGAWGRVESKLLDVTIDELEKTTPADANYPVAVEGFLRALNANLPVLLSGELDPVVTYHHDDVRVWGNRDRDLWTLYLKN